MFKVRQLTAVAFAAAFLVGACSSTGSTPTTAPATAAPATTAPTAAPSTAATAGPTTAASAGSEGATISEASTSLGMVLVGTDGRTLYLHAGDAPDKTTCAGACLKAWPPVTVSSGTTPTAGSGVMGTIGTFTGPDGATWVTYNQMPLYLWQGDTKPGDVTGQGVEGFTVALAAGVPAASAPAAPPSTVSNPYGY